MDLLSYVGLFYIVFFFLSVVKLLNVNFFGLNEDVCCPVEINLTFPCSDRTVLLLDKCHLQHKSVIFASRLSYLEDLPCDDCRWVFFSGP